VKTCYNLRYYYSAGDPHNTCQQAACQIAVCPPLTNRQYADQQKKW